MLEGERPEVHESVSRAKEESAAESPVGRTIGNGLAWGMTARHVESIGREVASCVAL